MSEKDELREHNFDGIQEYDNDLPRWWVWLFAVTVIFSIIYPFVYDFGPGEFASESIATEMAAIEELRQKAAAASAPALRDEAGLLQLASDSSSVQKGSAIYAGKCLPCHGDKGQGIIGPNLTDDYWIHGGKITEVRTIVNNGVLEKGMLAWKDQLSADEIDQVVAFIWTLHGTNPANPKAAEGQQVLRQ